MVKARKKAFSSNGGEQTTLLPVMSCASPTDVTYSVCFRGNSNPCGVGFSPSTDHQGPPGTAGWATCTPAASHHPMQPPLPKLSSGAGFIGLCGDPAVLGGLPIVSPALTEPPQIELLASGVPGRCCQIQKTCQQCPEAASGERHHNADTHRLLCAPPSPSL